MKGDSSRRRLGFQEIDTDLIDPNPNQPRAMNLPDDVRELADDIRARGLLAPLVVAPADTAGRYYLVAGSRRLDALRLNGAKRVTCAVRACSTEQALLEDALAENIQREALTDWEEANAIRQVMQMRGIGVREMAKLVNKSPAYVSKRLRVFANPALSEAVQAGLMSTSTAEELAAAKCDDDTIRSYIAQGVTRGAIRALAKERSSSILATAASREQLCREETEVPARSPKMILRYEGLGEIVAHLRDYSLALRAALVEGDEYMDEKCWSILNEANSAVGQCIAHHQSRELAMCRKEPWFTERARTIGAV